MKNLSNHIAEGLLDTNFDAPDFNFEPIVPNVPAFIDDGEHWRDNIVNAINAKMVPYKYYSQINDIIGTAADITGAIQKENVAITELGKLGAALVNLAKCKPLEIDEELIQTISDIRALNDWIGKANKDTEFKKIVSGLGGYFYAHIGKRNTQSGVIYGYVSYTLTSPNENAQLQLTKIAEKLSRVNKNIEAAFRMNGEGDGIFIAKLIKHAS